MPSSQLLAPVDPLALLTTSRSTCTLLVALLLSLGGAASVGFGQGPTEATDEAQPEYVNTIKWATASELDNFGFDVMRGDSEDGPFVRLNDTPIEGGGTTDSPRKYQYVDDTIDPHAIYYYFVESIALDGTREQFTPIAKVGPKIKGDEESKPADTGG